jgi:hypothetical protein
MEKLEKNHIIPHLPDGIKMKFSDDDVCEIVGLEINRILLISNTGDFGSCDYDGAGKLLLHPLSSLTKQIDCPDVMGEKIIPIIQAYKKIYPDSRTPDKIELEEFRIVFEWHNGAGGIESWCDFPLDMQYVEYGIIQELARLNIDFQGLIEKGLAIDINTIS